MSTSGGVTDIKQASVDRCEDLGMGTSLDVEAVSSDEDFFASAVTVLVFLLVAFLDGGLIVEGEKEEQPSTFLSQKENKKKHVHYIWTCA